MTGEADVGRIMAFLQQRVASRGRGSGGEQVTGVVRTRRGAGCWVAGAFFLPWRIRSIRRVSPRGQVAHEWTTEPGGRGMCVCVDVGGARARSVVLCSLVTTNPLLPFPNHHPIPRMHFYVPHSTRLRSKPLTTRH